MEVTKKLRHESTLDVLVDIAAALISPPSRTSLTAILQHCRQVLQKKGPRLQRALSSDAGDLQSWASQGPAWRLIVAASVASICGVCLSGLAAFVAALLVTAAFGFLCTILFTIAAMAAVLAVCLTTVAAMCIGAVVIAGSIISAVTFCAVLGCLFCGANALFLYFVWWSTSAVVQQLWRLVSPAGPSSTFTAREFPADEHFQSSTTIIFDATKPVQSGADVTTGVAGEVTEPPKGVIVTVKPKDSANKVEALASAAESILHPLPDLSAVS